MSLRTKLILAFVLLAVLPLTGITLYSYKASIRAFRRAVEAESGALAEEMGGRMDSMRRDLASQMDRLGSFPFRKLMEMKADESGVKSSPMMAQLVAEIGNVAALVDTIEFRPDVRRAPPPPAAAAPRKPDQPPLVDPEELVIHLSPGAAAPAAPSEARVPPAPPQIPEEAMSALSQAGRQEVEAQLRQVREYQAVMQKLSIERRKIAAEMKSAVEAAQKPALQAARVQQADPLAGNFGSVVRADGERVGTVRARVSSRQVFHEVFSRTRRRQGEIPFVVDAEGQLHAASPEEQTRLSSLVSPRALAAETEPLNARQLGDWVVVTRKEPDSNLTFGIARPIGQALQEIRKTAARNLGVGLALVGLALIGIMPLSNRMTRNLATLTRGADRLARGDLSTRVDVRSRDEIGRLADSFNRMSRELSENQRRLIEQERLRKELEMSRRIQEELLPKQPLHEGLVEAKGVSIPAREVGGDFFNYFPLPNGDIAILVGDVSGKGVAAALLMANLQATLQGRIPLASDLAELARKLDLEVASNTPPEVYLTLFMGIVNTAEKEMRYVNAGHHTQFALHASGSIEPLESTGRPLGLLPGGDFLERRTILSEGDALFLYTDGLVEAEDADGREFGRRRLEAVVLAQRSKGINEILSGVEQKIREHRGTVEAADDATMLVLKIGSAPPSQPAQEICPRIP
jgi:serine phosphatase RsbU (regulator of sigma subunit)